jgi:hypothetical protein
MRAKIKKVKDKEVRDDAIGNADQMAEKDVIPEK